MDEYQLADLADPAETFDEEVRGLLESDPHLSLEEAQYLVKVRIFCGYKTHVWI